MTEKLKDYNVSSFFALVSYHVKNRPPFSHLACLDNASLLHQWELRHSEQAWIALRQEY